MDDSDDRQPDVSRRTLLKAVGVSSVTVGLAGCLGGGGGDGTPTATDSPTPTETPAPTETTAEGDMAAGGTTTEGDMAAGGTTTEGDMASGDTTTEGDMAAGGTTTEGGTTTTNRTSSNVSGTVTWGLDPTVAQQNGEEVKQLFHDAGLSDDITIKFFAGAQDTGSRQQRYTQILRAGEENPDMFEMDNGWTIPFIVRGQIANLSEKLSQERLNRIDNEYFKTFTSTARHPETDELWAVPFRPGFPTIHYRKDLAKQAGYKPEQNGWATSPMTWKKFAKVIKDIRDQTGTKYGFSFQFTAYAGLSCCTFNEFMSSWGGAYFGGRPNLFGPIGERPVTPAKQPVQKSLRMIRTFIHGQDDSAALSDYTGSISPTNVLSWKEPKSLDPFKQGSAVAVRYWPSAIPQTLNAEDPASWVKPSNYGTMPIPYAVKESNALEPGTGGTTSALGGWHLTLNPNSQNKQAALEVIKTAMTKKVQLGLFDIAGWLPPDAGLFNSQAAQEVQPIGNYLNTLKVAGQNAMPRPVTVAWPQERKPIFQQVNSSASQDKSPEAALKRVDSQLTSIENSVASN